jgi:hypothetical protein
MNILREVAGGLHKMFAADTWLAVGILAVISLTGLFMGLESVGSLVGGAVLLLGCIAVLMASVLLTGRRDRGR